MVKYEIQWHFKQLILAIKLQAKYQGQFLRVNQPFFSFKMCCYKHYLLPRQPDHYGYRGYEKQFSIWYMSLEKIQNAVYDSRL